MKLSYYSAVSEEGKLGKQISALIAKEILHFKGKRVKITIERATSKRSLAQNALFHMYCGIMGESYGMTMEEVKEEMKDLYGRIEKVNQLTGEIKMMIQPTHLMGKMQMADLITGTIQHAANDGIVLPDPSNYEE